MSLSEEALRYHLNKLIDDAINHKLDDETIRSFHSIFDHYVDRTWHMGHDQPELITLQRIIDNKIPKEYKIKININHKFLTKHSKKLEKEFEHVNEKFINFKQWQKRIITGHKAMKKSTHNEIVIDVTRWLGHVRVATDNPSVILRDNPKTFHARAIYQISFHKLYAMWMGADCNGDEPGNSDDKQRFLASLTEYGWEGKRNQPHTQGLCWNYTMIKMSSLNDGDVNAAIYSPQTHKVIFSCSGMCGIHAITIIYSIIFNRQQMVQSQQEVLAIANDYKHAAKDFVKGSMARRKKLDEIRLNLMKILSATAHRLMDTIIPLTKKPIKVKSAATMVTGRRVQMPATAKPGRGQGNNKQSVHQNHFKKNNEDDDDGESDVEMKEDNQVNQHSRRVHFAKGTDFSQRGKSRTRTRRRLNILCAEFEVQLPCY